MSDLAAGVQAAEPATVLVVDAEVLVRHALADYLRDCGLRVVEAAGPEEARAVVADAGAPVSVALVALHGPLDPAAGFELARWIRQARPGVEVILAGTHARAADAAADICEQGPLLRRPYEPQIVLDRIRRLLARRPADGPDDDPAR